MANSQPEPVATPRRLRWSYARGIGLVVLLLLAPSFMTGCDESKTRDPKAQNSNARDAKSNGAARKAGSPASAKPVSAELIDRCELALGRFLEHGPEVGTWQVETPTKSQRWYLADHPTQEGVVLVADCLKNGQPCAVCPLSSLRIARLFFKPAPYLFFHNYRRTKDVVCESLEHGDDAIRLSWAHKDSSNGPARRCVWFSPDGKHVLRVEDHTSSGHLLRRVTHLDDGTGPFNPRVLGEKALAVPALKGIGATAARIERALKAPFPVYQPKYLPKGYVLIRADYSEKPLRYRMPSCCDQSEPTQDEKAQARVKMATLTYSDGLGAISICFAPPSDMDRIRQYYAKTDTTDQKKGCGESSPVTIEESEKKASADANQIRLRRNACRTVLSCEDLPEVHVRLLSRSELPVNEYLQVFRSLKRVMGD